MQDLRITMVQADIAWENIDLNLIRFQEKIIALAGKTDLVVLPELFTTGFAIHPPSATEGMDGKAVDWMKKMAGLLDAVITGSFLCKENGSVMNRLVWVEPGGKIHCYDKRHLFRMGNEHESLKAGNKKLVCSLKGWKINLMICYDLRFPVWSKNRMTKGNYEYDLIIYIANWPEVRSQAFSSLLTARAIENLAFAMGVNRVGIDGKGKSHSGNSVIYSPEGTVIVQAEPHKEQVITTVLSFEPVSGIRSKLNAGPDWDEFEIFTGN